MCVENKSSEGKTEILIMLLEGEVINKAKRLAFGSNSQKRPHKKWKKMIELEEVFMQWNPHGQIMSLIQDDATPFPHRSRVKFRIQYLVVWNEDGEEASDYHMGLVRSMYDFMTHM